MAQRVNNLPAIQETQVWSLGREDPLEKGMSARPSILTWRIPWTEEPGVLRSKGSQRVGWDWATNTHIGENYAQFHHQREVLIHLNQFQGLFFRCLWFTQVQLTKPNSYINISLLEEITLYFLGTQFFSTVPRNLCLLDTAIPAFYTDNGLGTSLRNASSL